MQRSVRTVGRVARNLNGLRPAGRMPECEPEFRGDRPCVFACVCRRGRWRSPGPCSCAAARRSSSRSERRRACSPRRWPPAPLPASIPAQDLVGRWGLAAYHKDEDRARTEAAARGQCRQPYNISRGPRGGVIMHLPDQSQPTELQPQGRPGRQELHRPRRGAGRRPARPRDRHVRRPRAGDALHRSGSLRPLRHQRLCPLRRRDRAGRQEGRAEGLPRRADVPHSRPEWPGAAGAGSYNGAPDSP